MAATTLTPTTLNADITDAAALSILVVATTDALAGKIAICDGEAMLVRSVNTTTKYVEVTRGQLGTVAALHTSGALVYFASPTDLSGQAPSANVAVSANERALPRIVINQDGISIFDVMGASATTSRWQKLSVNGFQVNTLSVSGAPGSGPVIYTALGAIAPQPGFVGINGTTLAMTIIDPTRAQDGMTMVIYAVNASAHTLTYTAGFNGGTTARDVCTFGGAIGDNLVIWANAGTWWVISTRNCTFG